MAFSIALRLLVALWMANAPHTWHGSWSANTASGGTTLGGTWDAEQSDRDDTVTGNWALMNAAGQTLATGTWAARKDQKVWSGSWQVRDASNRVFNGTWRARLTASPAEQFGAMLDSALTDAVSGTWRMGASQSGSWSIRTYKDQP